MPILANTFLSLLPWRSLCREVQIGGREGKTHQRPFNWKPCFSPGTGACRNTPDTALTLSSRISCCWPGRLSITSPAATIISKPLRRKTGLKQMHKNLGTAMTLCGTRAICVSSTNIFSVESFCSSPVFHRTCTISF